MSPAPVHALVGSDGFLQLQKLLSLLRQLPDDVQRVDVDGERAELAEVLDELRSFAMFGAGKLVVIRNGDAFVTRFREPLEKYVADPSSSGVLVLRLSSLPANTRLYKAIAKTGRIEQCTPPKDVARWVTDQARAAHGITLSSDAARLLVELIGGDLGRLDNEIAKLALQAPKGRVGADDITGTISFQREQKMFDMTNEIAAGRPAEALRRWRQLVQLDPSAEFRAVTWLTMWLENVRKALALRRQGVSQGIIARECRIFRFELQAPFFRTVNALGEPGVARALDLLAEIDRQSKSGVGDAASNVERFLLSLPLGHDNPHRRGH